MEAARGANDQPPGGGGAGGYIYHGDYPLGDNETIPVKVGLGGIPPETVGPGQPTSNRGARGGNSQFGEGDTRIEAYGGSGGASHAPGVSNKGTAGGSGGGGVNNYAGGTPNPGVAPQGADSYVCQGGTGLGTGGGGGGAGGAGQTVADSNDLAHGGKGVPSDISGVSQWYAGGGSAGDVADLGAVEEDVPAEAYGANGGQNAEPHTGDGGGSSGAGGSGIVIVRWPYEEPEE